jgi:Serpin (serine protease inhibitor)
MAVPKGDVVQAVNLLTVCWANHINADRNEVVSGVGVLALLTALLAASDGEARELESATLLRHEDAAPAAEWLLAELSSLAGTAAALGIWTRQDVPLDGNLRGSIPRITLGAFPSNIAELDMWAYENTNAMIDRFPGTITADTRLVAASVISVEADWVTPFSVSMGRWGDDPSWFGWLYRNGIDQDSAALISNDTITVSRLVCTTVGGFDVHLVAGDETDTPTDVLGLAIGALDGTAQITVGSQLHRGDKGGCLVVEKAAASTKDPQIQVSLPAFDVTSNHNLLERAALFGLTAAQDRSRGHFPGVSSYPLAIESAAQSAVASFSATGFRAGAVTMAMAMAGGRPPSEQATVVRMTFDRPFGFVVVDRVNNLAMFAGWIAHPTQPDPFS